MKLTETQKATLLRLVNGSGWEAPPGGYVGAGRDASRWWRTMGCLERQGLVRRERDPKGRGTTSVFSVTDEGRARTLFAEVLEALKKLTDAHERLAREWAVDASDEIAAARAVLAKTGERVATPACTCGDCRSNGCDPECPRCWEGA